MSSSSSDMDTLDVPGFFVVKSRSGDPTTEDLHARTSNAKRFNNGESYTMRGRRGGSSPPVPSSQARGVLSPAAALLSTETHAVVRAGSVPAIAAAAASSANHCSGRVLSHGWAFLCVDGGVFAWEQGMVSAERAGATAASAGQACLRFDHPTMVAELVAMEVLEVPVEAADLVALTQPWEACGGKRELLLVSPGGLARYWPDLHSPRRFTDVNARSVAPGHSVTRVVSLGPADFLCGLSNGGILRVRPGLAQPCLLAQSSSVLGLSFSTIKRMGSFIGHKTFAAAEPPPALDAASPMPASARPVVGLFVVRPPRGSPATTPARVIRLTTETLEVWSVTGGQGGGAGIESLEARQPLLGKIQSALGVRKACLVDLALAGVATSVCPGGEAYPNWGLELLVLAVSVEERGENGGGEEAFSVHAVRVSSEEASWVGSSVSIKLLSSYRVTGGPAVTAGAGLPFPRAALVADNEAFFSGDVNAIRPGSWGVGGGGGVGAHVFCPTSGVARVWSMTVKMLADEGVEWEGRGSVEVSSRVALLGGGIGGGAALLGCPGVVLLSAQGQAVWIAPRETSGRAVDLESSEMSSDMAAEEWRLALLNDGLSAFEAGETMDTARTAVDSLLRSAQGGGILSSDLDAAVIEAGLEVLNGTWRHPAALASPHQLVHLALREKGRRHRAFVRFLLDAGVWGVVSAGRAVLAEGGEKIAAAARLCELQDAISRNVVGIKAAGLLENCLRLSLLERVERGVAEGGGGGGASARDQYFEHTEGVLDALVELHTPRLDDSAPSSAIDGATLTPLEHGLRDASLDDGHRLALLNQISLVVSGVFEAALRHRASERSVYRTGTRGKVWTASDEARRILFQQLQAYAETIDTIEQQGAGRGDSDVMCGVIGRLSVLLLDGFKEEEEANPAASGKVEWQGEYMEAKALSVRVVAACGREDLARSLANKHGYLEGTVRLCHEAETRKPGCQNGHSLLRRRMELPLSSPVAGGEEAGAGESEEDRLEREHFAHFVLDWHLRHGFKTALLDVGAAVPNVLCEFLADWREAELLWMFQIRLQDYTGAERALMRGSAPANQKGGKYEAQHLWLSLAKLAHLAGGDAASADPARGAEIQRRLELAEVRERLVRSLPVETAVSNQPWTWQRALAESADLVRSYSTRTSECEIVEAADIAFQGYRAIVAGLSENSHERADELWREVVGVTLNDPNLKEAVAKGAMPSVSEDDTMVTDREMEAVWKRPTVLHLLLRAISKDRRLRRETPWAGGRGEGEEGKIDLTDHSLVAMVHELMPAAADGNGATCESWIAAIRKCPW